MSRVGHLAALAAVASAVSLREAKENSTAPSQGSAGYAGNSTVSYAGNSTATYSFAYTLPNTEKWPTLGQYLNFTNTLSDDAEVVTPFEEKWSLFVPGYENITNCIGWCDSVPGMRVMPATFEDVRKSVEFAKEHGLRVSVVSSGHDYNGKNTYPGSLQIVTKKLKVMSYDKDKKTVTVQSGVQVGDTLETLDGNERVVVTGRLPSVALAGITLGAGHGVLSRRYGFAVDNALSFKIVTPNATIVHVSPDGVFPVNGTEVGKEAITNSSDLYWALRGGGGPTFGVLLEMTYQTHPAPKTIVELKFALPYFADIAKSTMKRYFLNGTWLGELNEGFGTWIQCLPGSACNVIMNYAGDEDPKEFPEMKEIIGKLEEGNATIDIQTYEKYGDLIRSTGWGGTTYLRSYLFNGLFETVPDEALDALFAMVEDEGSPFIFAAHLCMGNGTGTTKVAGNATAVHPDLRTHPIELLVSYNCIDPGACNRDIGYFSQPVAKITSLSNSAYINELSTYGIEGANKDWEKRLWGDNYPRLLKIKKEYDPENFFTTRCAVGSTFC